MNRRFIRSKNRENLKYKLAPNNFADMTEEEIDLHRGLLHDEKEKKNPRFSEVLYFNQSLLTSGLVPDELDWRDYGKRLSSRIKLGVNQVRRNNIQVRCKKRRNFKWRFISNYALGCNFSSGTWENSPFSIVLVGEKFSRKHTKQQRRRSQFDIVESRVHDNSDRRLLRIQP